MCELEEVEEEHVAIEALVKRGSKILGKLWARVRLSI